MSKYDPLDAKSVAAAFVRDQEEWWDEEFIEQDISLLAEMLAPMQAAIATRDEQIAALTAERDAAREALRTYGHHDEDCPLALVAPDVDDVCECDFYAALGGGE